MPGTYLHEVNPTYFPAQKKKKKERKKRMLMFYLL